MIDAIEHHAAAASPPGWKRRRAALAMLLVLVAVAARSDARAQQGPASAVHVPPVTAKPAEPASPASADTVDPAAEDTAAPPAGPGPHPVLPPPVAATPAPPEPRSPPPARLVVQVIIDQLRGDFAMLSRAHWGKGGFDLLYDDGAVFTDAHHAHANTETIVGHATLATGADPSVHGMIGNAWYDRAEQSLRYNIEDSRYEIVGDDGVASGGNGHPGVTKRARGRSPEALLAPTIADSIASEGKGAAKVFAVSLKDRAAVPMAGKAGKAFWWSDATGEFISSTYYYPERRLPAWVEAWNHRHLADTFDGKTWGLLLPPKSYRHLSEDGMPWEEPPAGMGSTFPHRFDRGALGAGYYSAVAASPFGDDILLDFTRTLLTTEELGRDDVIDYLSVSFSSNDFIGHRYGPSSLEIEDEILRVDRLLAALLAEIDRSVGLEHTLVAVSSDHGVAEAPEELEAAGRSAGRVLLSEVERSEAISNLTQKVGGKLVRNRWPPYVYLDTDALRRHGVDPDVAAADLATELARMPGIEAAFSRAQILGNRLPNTEVARAVRRNFHLARSGDVHVVPRPGWQLAYEGETSSRYATGHGTPWRYDSWVPVIFFGPGVEDEMVGKRVETVDVVPTLATLAGVPIPALATGKVLKEAFD
jgi:predicted AlkP superfamily pyrophosphatase or phosphodiesterase